jgi:2-(1,2-epoxy-1,2-dihydrophenyl)acetyl-CoA isomerase
MSDYQATEGLQIDVVDGVLELTLDRPEKRNSLTDTMVNGLIEAISKAGRDESVRVVVLQGAGEHFCGGFDIIGRNAGNGAKPRVGSIQRRLPVQAHRLIPTLLSVQTPIVCAAQGWVAGIGLHLLLASDFAVVTDDSRLWEPFSERGFTPDSGATWMLPRRIGEVRAREMLLLGRKLSGQEAADWGMVHKCVPGSSFDNEVLTLVERLGSGPTIGLGLTKWLLLAGATEPIEAQLQNEALAMEISSRSQDFREGLSAFVEKRPPRFSGC